MVIHNPCNRAGRESLNTAQLKNVSIRFMPGTKVAQGQGQGLPFAMAPRTCPADLQVQSLGTSITLTLDEVAGGVVPNHF